MALIDNDIAALFTAWALLLVAVIAAWLADREDAEFYSDVFDRAAEVAAREQQPDRPGQHETPVDQHRWPDNPNRPGRHDSDLLETNTGAFTTGDIRELLARGARLEGAA